MIVFLIVEVKIIDDVWVFDYVMYVYDIVVRYGGCYLLCSGNIEMLEGVVMDEILIVLIQFFDCVLVYVFVNDLDYVFYGKVWQDGLVSYFWVIDDIDLVGVIFYLFKV